MFTYFTTTTRRTTTRTTTFKLLDRDAHGEKGQLDYERQVLSLVKILKLVTVFIS